MDLEIGQVVRSRAGRDKDKHYIVIGFEGERVLVADGRARTVKQPKKKNLRHLQPYRFVIEEIKERIRQGNLSDAVLREQLNLLHSAEKDDSRYRWISSTPG